MTSMSGRPLDISDQGVRQKWTKPGIFKMALVMSTAVMSLSYRSLESVSHAAIPSTRILPKLNRLQRTAIHMQTQSRFPNTSWDYCNVGGLKYHAVFSPSVYNLPSLQSSSHCQGLPFQRWPYRFSINSLIAVLVVIM